MQVMAVAAGGTLSQHVPDLTGTSAHAPAPGHYGQTQVTSTHGSRVARIIGGAAAVRCSHHQSVATAPGYVGTAYSADGVLEAMEAPSARFRLGVQWHPEASDDTCVFAALVTAAAHAPSRR
jgi:putative glutamine amidotransferase